MKIAIRVDASTLIGSGHVMRCLVLADAIKAKGHHVVFVCLPLNGALIDYVKQRGHDVIKLSQDAMSALPPDASEYEIWLQRPIETDAYDFLAYVGSLDIVITDHYAIGYSWQKIVKATLNCKIVAIDDLCREHMVDLLVDQTLGRHILEYPSVKNVLAGSDYALLSPDFYKKRENAFTRKLDRADLKVLITMGGVDRHNVTLQVLHTLVNALDAKFTVLLGKKAPHYEAVKEFCAEFNHINHLDFCDDMPSLMLQHAVSIGAPGMTSWERACLGLPSIIIPIADNQKHVAESLNKSGVSEVVSMDAISSDLKPALDKLLQNYTAYLDTSLGVCDGLGINRVVQEILDENPLRLVKANEGHIEIIYAWQSHEQTRKYSNNANVPSCDDHVAWMQRKLASYTDYFYLAQMKETGEYCAAVRLDRVSENKYVISIFLNPECYGKKIGAKVLALIDEIHPVKEINAQVLIENSASQKLFERAGYTRINAELFIRK